MYWADCRKLTLVILVLLMSISTACSPANASAPVNTGTPPMAKVELSLSQLKWKLAGITHYRFRLFHGCICEDNEDVLIEVESEQIISIEHPSWRALNEHDQGFFDSLGTMERLFGRVENELNGDVLEVNVKYEPTYGFPVEIYSDHTEIT